jgi:hypothetical protein
LTGTQVLLVTCADLPHGDEDGQSLLDALAAHGVDARWCAWTDPTVDWAAADLVVLRSSWDYTLAYADFVRWAEAVPRLMNPASVVAWNSDKTYLRDLAAAGLAVVPTQWAAPGEQVELPISGEYVIKPSVGAGSKGAGRFGAGEQALAQAHLDELHAAGRTAMVQPYLSGVDEHGETALIYLGGRYSHAVTKGAMLAPGTANRLDVALPEAFAARELFVEERIEATAATAAQRTLGDDVLAFVLERWPEPPLYTRVDLLPTATGPVVVELELVEPSLFLGYEAGAADRFASLIASAASAATG